MVQWLRIHLPMQGTWVPSLIREDPTCRGATKPVRHNYWACALEPASHNYWAHTLQLPKPTRLKPELRNKRSHRDEKSTHGNKEKPPPAATRESLCAATKTQRSAPPPKKKENNLKKKKVLTYATTWMNLESIMQSEQSCSQRTTGYMITFIWNVRSR